MTHLDRFLQGDLRTLLDLVRESPGMWLGELSITGLGHLLGGIRLAEMHHRVPEVKKLPGFDFDSFENWVQKRFNPERLSVRSFWLARQSSGNESDGFDLWYKWYDEFLALPPAIHQR